MSLVMFDSGNKFSINALFIQPSYYCAGNCKNCYVKQHQKNGNQVSPEVMGELFKMAYHYEDIICNQITVSMDCIPGESNYWWIRNFVAELYKAYSLSEKSYTLEHPEVHMTFRDAATLFHYTRMWFEIWKLPKVITLSNIRETDLPYIFSIKNKYKSLKFNYNHMISWGVSIDQEIKRLKQILQVVDSIYLVMEKNPVGRERDLLEAGLDRKRTRDTLEYFNVLRKQLNSPKVMLDGCICDALEYNKTGYGCSAGVSRFQVWPDGSVSGCAYAKESSTSPADTAEGIIQNIRNAKNKYDFKKCYIPSAIRE